MKYMLLALILLSTGCSLFGTNDRFPEVWVVSEVHVRIGWPITAGDSKIEDIKDLLELMNAKIYDATDGQIRIAKFTVHPPNLWNENGIGVCNIIPTDDKAAERGYSTVGDPQYPGTPHIQIQGGSYTVDQAGGVAAHEWFHAYVGVLDEYKRADGSKSKCPDSIITRTLADSCIMYSYIKSEFCRPDNHSKKTEQNDRRGMSCYEWLKKVVAEKGKGTIQIPGEHRLGPIDPPTPIVEFKFY